MTDFERVFRERPGVWAVTHRKRPIKQNLTKGLFYCSAVLLSLFSLIPILWGLSTSLKLPSAIYAIPPEWVPKRISFQNYVQVISDSLMLKYFLNTLIIAVGCTVFSLIISVLAAFGFSRHRFPGDKAWLWAILFTRILPRVTIIIPFFVTLRNLRLINTYVGLILVYLIVVMPLSVWLLKGFLDNIPHEIDEAAIVDGCSPLRLLFTMIVPISLPAISAVAMYAFILAWNEFLFALVMSSDAAIRPISIGLAFYIDESGISWGSLMAASILMSIPAFIVFGLFQKQLVKGLSEGAVKG